MEKKRKKIYIANHKAVSLCVLTREHIRQTWITKKVFVTFLDKKQ